MPPEEPTQQEATGQACLYGEDDIRACRYCYELYAPIYRADEDGIERQLHGGCCSSTCRQFAEEDDEG